MFPDKEGYKSPHITLDRASYTHDLADFHFTFLELPKFTLTMDELSTMEEKWCYYLKHAPDIGSADYERLIVAAPILKRAYDMLDTTYWDEKQLRTYEKEEKNVRDAAAILENSFTEGLEKGLEQGREQGREQGLEQGSRGKALRIAKKMLKLGKDISEIMDLTELSYQEIQELQEMTPVPAASH